MKSASQIIGSSGRAMSSKKVNCGVHSSSISRRRRWNRGSALEAPAIWNRERLDFPDPLAAVAAVALDHARAGREPRREFDTHRLGRSIEGRVTAPAHRAGAMQDLLGAHLEDYIRMSAHPDAARRDLAQQRVEIGTVAPFVDRVDPDEYAIECGKLSAHGLEDIVLVDYRFRVDTDIDECREDSLETACSWRGAAAGRFVATRKNSNAAEASFGLRHGQGLRIFGRAQPA